MKIFQTDLYNKGKTDLIIQKTIKNGNISGIQTESSGSNYFYYHEWHVRNYLFIRLKKIMNIKKWESIHNKSCKCKTINNLRLKNMDSNGLKKEKHTAN